MDYIFQTNHQMDALFSRSIVLFQYSHTLSQILSLKWGKKNLVVIMGMSDV